MTKKNFNAVLSDRMGARDVFFKTSDDLPQLIEADIDKLRPNPDQPRKIFDEERLRELAASIQENGLLQLIAVERDPEVDGGYVIVHGERRWRAHKLLQRGTIPAILTAGNRRVRAVVENLQREDLQPLELAQSLAELKSESNFTDEQLAKTVGKSRSYVTEILRLNTLPEAIRSECRTSDAVSKSLLLEVARIEDRDAQQRRWEEIKQGGSTVRQMRAAKKGLAPSAAKTPEEKTLAAGRGFVRRLSQLVYDVEEDTEVFAQLREVQRRINDLIGGVGTGGDPDQVGNERGPDDA